MDMRGKMEKLRPGIYFVSAYIHVKLCCEIPNNHHTYGQALSKHQKIHLRELLELQ